MRRFAAASIFALIAVFGQTVWTAETKPEKSVTGENPVEYIDGLIRQGWAEKKLIPSPRASDAEWCRRVFLDVLGRVPSVPEWDAFLRDKSADKRAKLVDRLLTRDEYIEEYARNWTTIWTNILIGRNGGMEDNSLTSREGMQSYLRRSFQTNKPYDRMVNELVTATGDNKPDAEKFNGAVNYLVGKMEEKGAQATAKTAQIFLGLQVQCTQCHNHPFNDWKQNQFWELNAFFRQTTTLRTFVAGTRDVQVVRLANQDFAGEHNDASEAVLFYELRNGNLKSALPVFVDGTAISPSGYLQEVDRRNELGKLIVKSDWMAKAIVSRMWGHFLGYGFTKPADDMGPHNEPVPAHAQLLDKLARDFRARSFDLKELIRWITLSEAYALSSKAERNGGNKLDDPALGEKPRFSRFYLRQMRAEELYESLLVATQAHRTQGSYEEQEAEKRRWLRQFVVAFGTDDGEETTTFNGTIPQVLMMMNGDLVKKAISCESGSFLHSVATNSKLAYSAKVEYLFMSALSRRATADEQRRMASFFLSERKGDVPSALQDVWWVILNTNEFILNH